jgi:hypothetical protein
VNVEKLQSRFWCGRETTVGRCLPSDPWDPSLPSPPWRPHVPDGPQGVGGDRNRHSGLLP